MALFADDLARLTGNDAPAMDVGQQYHMLIQRADEFSSLGEFQRATSLREAALLIKFDADDQRIKLVREYAGINFHPTDFGDYPKNGSIEDKRRFQASVVEQVKSNWKRALQHCEYLIRNHRISREVIAELTHQSIQSLMTTRSTALNNEFAECETIKKDFLRTTYIRIFSLAPANDTERRRLVPKLTVYDCLFEDALRRCEGNYFTNDDLDLIADLLLNRLPASMEPSHKLNYLLNDIGSSHSRKPSYYRFTDEEYRAFLDRLIASDRPLVCVYGRYGKLCYRRYGKREASQALLDEARAIVAAAEQQIDPDQRKSSHFLLQMRTVADSLAQALEPKTASMRLQSTSTQVTTSPERVPSRVAFHPITFRVVGGQHDGKKLSSETKWRAPGGWAPVKGYRPLNDDLDTLWASGAVLFVHEPGKAVEVLADEQLYVNDVISDGRYIWVAAAYEWGLSVLDCNGNELARIAKEQGLPPCDHHGMVVYPLESGRILASGSFGNQHRAWIAIIEFDGNESNVEVIHEATKVLNGPRDSNNLDPALGYIPQSIFGYVHSGSVPQQTIFITRINRQPLLVNPESRAVWLYPDEGVDSNQFPALNLSSDAYLDHDGLLWIANSNAELRSYRYDEETGRLQVVRGHPNMLMYGAQAGSLALDGDWLYLAANKRWRRLNLRTGEDELLVGNSSGLPANYFEWHLSKSGLYGLVAFYDGKLYRIEVDSM